MTELNKLLEYVDNHVFLAAHIHGYLWGISKNAIIGIAVDNHFPFVVNNTYLKNALRDNDDNFCSLDVYEYNNGNITPDLLQMTDYDDTDKIETFIKNNRDEVNVKHYELESNDTTPKPTLRNFFELLSKTEDRLSSAQTE